MAGLFHDRGSEQLAQSRPSGTGATQAYSPPTNRRATLTKIIIANSTAGSVNASVYIDTDGTTYDQTTALRYAYAIAANSFHEIVFEDGWEIEDAANVAVQTSSANALTFTVLGRESDAG